MIHGDAVMWGERHIDGGARGDHDDATGAGKRLSQKCVGRIVTAVAVILHCVIVVEW